MAAHEGSDAILWKRWTDGEMWMGGFYRACAVFPFDNFREPRVNEPPFKIIHGPIRLSFRHVPLVTLIFSLLLIISSPDIFSSITQLLSDFTILLAGILLVSIWIFVMIWFIFKVRIIEDTRHFLWLIITSFTISILITGSALAIFLSYSTNPGIIVGPRLIYDSGALLFFVLFGLLGYDTMLRTENFISNYPNSNSLADTTEYNKLLSELEKDLSYNINQIPVSYLFGAVIQIPYLPFLYGGVKLSLINIIYLVINFHLLVFLFQIFIVSKFLVHLVCEGRFSGNGWQIIYRPLHPDRRAGFRDLGRFGVHTGVILILIGLMFLYFLHVQGQFSRIPNDIGLAWAMWVTAFIVPIFIYAILFHAFIYYYFGSIHRYMAEMRYNLIRDVEADLRNGSQQPRVNYDKELTSEIIDAPIWPVGIWKLRLLYVVGLVPILLSLPMLIGWQRFLELIGLLPFL